MGFRILVNYTLRQLNGCICDTYLISQLLYGSHIIASVVVVVLYLQYHNILHECGQTNGNSCKTWRNALTTSSFMLMDFLPFWYRFPNKAFTIIKITSLLGWNKRNFIRCSTAEIFFYHLNNYWGTCILILVRTLNCETLAHNYVQFTQK